MQDVLPPMKFLQNLNESKHIMSICWCKNKEERKRRRKKLKNLYSPSLIWHYCDRERGRRERENEHAFVCVCCCVCLCASALDSSSHEGQCLVFPFTQQGDSSHFLAAAKHHRGQTTKRETDSVQCPHWINRLLNIHLGHLPVTLCADCFLHWVSNSYSHPYPTSSSFCVWGVSRYPWTPKYSFLIETNTCTDTI